MTKQSSNLPDDVQEHLDNIKATLARASIGDYSHDLKVPKNGFGEFEEIYTGIQMLLEDMRARMIELDQLKRAAKSRQE